MNYNMENITEKEIEEMFNKIAERMTIYEKNYDYLLMGLNNKMADQDQEILMLKEQIEDLEDRLESLEARIISCDFTIVQKKDLI